LSKLEENKTLDELKLNTNKVDYEVLNITVFKNLSSVPNEDGGVSNFPIILQTDGTMLI